MLEAIILILTVRWLFSFFGQSIVNGIPRPSGFIDMLAVVIITLIFIRFIT
ncbi:MAG: hypothetical protein IH589_17415 [Anaerolineales bacterium]|nr:hypothetical protein [Anaerolineales bacterium]